MAQLYGGPQDMSGGDEPEMSTLELEEKISCLMTEQMNNEAELGRLQNWLQGLGAEEEQWCDADSDGFTPIAQTGKDDDEATAAVPLLPPPPLPSYFPFLFVSVL